jgi:cytochrome c2
VYLGAVLHGIATGHDQFRVLCSRPCIAAACATVLAIALSACTDAAKVSARTGGDPHHGEQVVRSFGCASCHDIPGIARPRGYVGPPLEAFARRTYIAGELPNTPTNLVRWVMDPRALVPRTAMPALGLTQAQAQDVAAYLYTLD